MEKEEQEILLKNSILMLYSGVEGKSDAGFVRDFLDETFEKIYGVSAAAIIDERKFIKAMKKYED